MKAQLLVDLVMFTAVVDQKSFTSAAQIMGVTKSVISKHISRLEKDLGMQLLRRSTRKLSLTQAGEMLYEYCIRIKNDIDEAEAVIRYKSNQPVGLLRVNSSISFGHLHLAPAIAEFIHQYPDVKVQMLLGEYYGDLIENGLDLAVRVGELPVANIIGRRICSLPMRVCGSPSYFNKFGVPKHPRELKDHNCLLYDNSPTGNDWVFYGAEGEIRIKIDGNFSASNSLALEAAAITGLGIVMLPGYMMTQHIKDGLLKCVLEDYCPPHIKISLVYAATRFVAPKVRHFIDFLVERFSDNSYWQ